ncbi:hypothetical protein BDA99DRAFT_506414 [Phascolomyces articulosus]|uniref:ATP synthase subunit K, mitochondrial n=1 Tax=Phascolomyces articulosus TaxID=60185 RepID=A0AAD5PFA6_9FUNG|nr:hypothetical protein BDA99DRAFT_506414 [Phascolomyces articulosus]
MTSQCLFREHPFNFLALPLPDKYFFLTKVNTFKTEMGGHYVIAGKAVSNHLIAMGFLGAYAAAGAYFALKPKAPQPATPPIKAGSADEEAFIKEFLKAAESDDSKQ